MRGKARIRNIDGDRLKDVDQNGNKIETETENDQDLRQRCGGKI